jgi:hypothetical protein
VDAAANQTYVERTIIYSEGGAVQPALKIGRYIRAMRMETYGPYADEPYDPARIVCPVFSKVPSDYLFMEYNLRSKRGDSRCICASACFLIWVGGIWSPGRTGTLNEKISIHRIAFDPSQYGKLTESEAKQLYETEQHKIEAYLQEMGVPAATTQRMFTIPSERVEFLTKDELAVLKQTPAYLQEYIGAKCNDSMSCWEQFRRQQFFEGAKKIESID